MLKALVLVGLAALLLPAVAAAHGRGATVALDYRLRLVPAALPGVRLGVLDGDRSLAVSVARGTNLVVRGYLREPVIRIGAQGVWVNAASPTAQADKLVPQRAGWVKVSAGRSWAWHDHRLAPPPLASARNAVPLTVNGRARTVAVLFARVPRPSPWPWLAVAAALLAVIPGTLRVPRLRAPVTIALAVLGGAAAAAGSVAFALRDRPSGGTGWLQVGATAAVAALLAALLVRSGPRRRAHAAGVAGAVAAAGTLTFLPVFWHGVVVSALPATAARLACGLALVCGAGAAGLSFLPEFDEPVRAR